MGGNHPFLFSTILIILFYEHLLTINDVHAALQLIHALTGKVVDLSRSSSADDALYCILCVAEEEGFDTCSRSGQVCTEATYIGDYVFHLIESYCAALVLENIATDRSRDGGIGSNKEIGCIDSRDPISGSKGVGTLRTLDEHRSASGNSVANR